MESKFQAYRRRQKEADRDRIEKLQLIIVEQDDIIKKLRAEVKLLRSLLDK